MRKDKKGRAADADPKDTCSAPTFNFGIRLEGLELTAEDQKQVQAIRRAAAFWNASNPYLRLKVPQSPHLGHPPNYNLCARKYRAYQSIRAQGDAPSEVAPHEAVTSPPPKEPGNLDAHYGAVKSPRRDGQGRAGDGRPGSLPQGRGGGKAGQVAHRWELLAMLGLFAFVVCPLVEKALRSLTTDLQPLQRRGLALPLA